MKDNKGPAITIIVAIATILGTVFGVAARYTSRDTFEEYKTANTNYQAAIEKRLERIERNGERIEEKIDRILVDRR